MLCNGLRGLPSIAQKSTHSFCSEHEKNFSRICLTALKRQAAAHNYKLLRPSLQLNIPNSSYRPLSTRRNQNIAGNRIHALHAQTETHLEQLPGDLGLGLLQLVPLARR